MRHIIKIGAIILSVAAFFITCATSASYAEKIVLRSSLVWAPDAGDYTFKDNGTLKNAKITSSGEIEVTDTAKTNGSYTSSIYQTQEPVGTLTINWEFTGEVTMQASIDGGANYVTVVNGTPYTFIQADTPGQQTTGSSYIRWKAIISAGSTLKKVSIDYQDANTQTIDTNFGSPQLSGFTYRKPITLINTSEHSLFNTQIKIKIAESSGATTPYDVQCDNKIHAGFKDIRFTAADGTTVLPYYIEKITGSSPNRIAYTWVEIPQLPASQTLTIYLYYGNPNAEDLSSAEAVFDFYDDFTTARADTNKWQIVNGTYTINNSWLKLTNTELISRQYKIKDGIIELSGRIETGGIGIILRTLSVTGADTATQTAYSTLIQGKEHSIEIADTKQNQPNPIQKNTNYLYRAILKGKKLTFERYNAAAFSADETPTSSTAENNTTTTEKTATLEPEATITITANGHNALTKGAIGIKTTAGGIVDIDWIRVRKDPSAIQIIKPKQDTAQKISMPEFQNTTIAENGDLTLSPTAPEGRYISATIPLQYSPRVIIPSWEENTDTTAEDTGKVKLRLSIDGGLHYGPVCENAGYYYSSNKDFGTVFSDSNNTATDLKIKLTLQRSRANSPQIKQITADYRKGLITVNYPDGGQRLNAGDTIKILFSAPDYEPTYKMLAEYSLDNGDHYTLIEDGIAVSEGMCVWQIPEGISTTQALIRIVDTKDTNNFGTSSAPFTILSGQEDNTTLTPEEQAALEKELMESEEIDIEKLIQAGRRPGTILYDLLIKIGNNYNPDPEEDARASYKNGDIITVRPHGFNWSKTERNSYLILQVYLKRKEADTLMMPKTIIEKDKTTGEEITRMVRRRAVRINLKKLGIKDKIRSKTEKIREIEYKLKGRPVITDKILQKK